MTHDDTPTIKSYLRKAFSLLKVSFTKTISTTFEHCLGMMSAIIVTFCIYKVINPDYHAKTIGLDKLA